MFVLTNKYRTVCHPRERGDPGITGISMDPDFRQDDKPCDIYLRK